MAETGSLQLPFPRHSSALSALSMGLKLRTFCSIHSGSNCGSVRPASLKYLHMSCQHVFSLMPKVRSFIARLYILRSLSSNSRTIG